MIAIIRIRGQANTKEDIENTLQRLRLRRKYSCVVLPEKPEILGMIEKVKDKVAFGSIDKNTLIELIKKRGRLAGDKPIDNKESKEGKEDKESKIIEQAIAEIEKGKLLSIKPFFRLHPPKGGFKKSVRYSFPRGILGKNKNINELIKKML